MQRKKDDEKRRFFFFKHAAFQPVGFLEAECSFSSVPFVTSNISPNPGRVFKNRTSFNEPVDSSLSREKILFSILNANLGLLYDRRIGIANVSRQMYSIFDKKKKEEKKIIPLTKQGQKNKNRIKSRQSSGFKERVRFPW